MGLGSQCCQLLQLLYLDPFDHWLKEQCKVKHYLRYMDDMILLVKTKAEADELLEKISAYLGKIGLKLNPKSHIG